MISAFLVIVSFSLCEFNSCVTTARLYVCTSSYTQQNNLRPYESITHNYSCQAYFNIFVFFYQGFLQTVSNLFDENNLRDFTQLQKVYLDSFLILSILVSPVDNVLKFIVNLIVVIRQTLIHVY